MRHRPQPMSGSRARQPVRSSGRRRGSGPDWGLDRARTADTVVPSQSRGETRNAARFFRWGKAWLGKAGRGEARFFEGVARRVEARSGTVGRARYGVGEARTFTWLGPVWRGGVWRGSAWSGKARFYDAGQGVARPGEARSGSVGPGKVRRGTERLGLAGRGKARQGGARFFRRG